jgi:hypothetical protein
VIDPALGLLLVKMATASGIIVGCSLLAERSGPVVAGIIAAFPISMGPVLVFLAMDHDSAFIAGSVLGVMTATLVHSILILVYVLLAQRHSTLVSLGCALIVWCCVLSVVRWLDLTVIPLAILTLLSYGVCYLVTRPYMKARPKKPPPVPWFAIPLRAACVAALAGTVTLLSQTLGPMLSGIMAGLPIVLSSLIVILQPRIGGPATAAIIAYAALGMLGVGLSLGVTHLLAVPLGSWAALGTGLLLCMGWSLLLARLARRPAP